MERVKVAIIGPGNIGSDLMYKVKKSKYLELSAVIGIADSEGIQRAKDMGITTSTEGVSFVEKNPDIAEIFFDATTAKAHKEQHAPVLEALGKMVIDLTPAAVGEIVSPVVNVEKVLEHRNINLITCGGQAATPIVYAINRVAPLSYAELVTTASSKSIGPGTRDNIDEFTYTTAHALEVLGGAEKAKVLTIINPAVPEVTMRNTIYTVPKDDFDIEEVKKSVDEIVKEVQQYVPGYELTIAPQLDKGIITTIVSVRGSGDFLPEYAGNLDIETASAVQVAQVYAQNLLAKEKSNE